MAASAGSLFGETHSLGQSNAEPVKRDLGGIGLGDAAQCVAVGRSGRKTAGTAATSATLVMAGTDNGWSAAGPGSTFRRDTNVRQTSSSRWQARTRA